MPSLILELDNITNLPDGGPTSFTVLGTRSVDIGRDTYLDWTLPDPNRIVSGRHCEVRYVDGGYVLTDRSTNGTYLNGSDKRLSEPTRLKTGDIIDIGPYIIKVTVHEDETAAPPPADTGSAFTSADQASLWDAPEAAPPAPVTEKKRRGGDPVLGDALDWRMDMPRVDSQAEVPPPPEAPATWRDTSAPPPSGPPPAASWDAPPPGDEASQSWDGGASPSSAWDAAPPQPAPPSAQPPEWDTAPLPPSAETPSWDSAPPPASAETPGWDTAPPPPSAETPSWDAAPSPPAGGWGEEGQSPTGGPGAPSRPDEPARTSEPDEVLPHDPPTPDPPEWRVSTPTPQEMDHPEPLAIHASEAPPPASPMTPASPAGRDTPLDAPAPAAPTPEVLQGAAPSAEPPAGAVDGPAPPAAPVEAEVPGGPAPLQPFAASEPGPASPRPFAPQPRHESRSAHPAHETSSADYEAFLVRLSQTTGVPLDALKAEGPEALADKLGYFMVHSVAGLHALLKARATSRGFLRSERGTTVEALGNNPMKFLPTPEDVLRVLMGPPTRTYLSMDEALQQSYADVSTHQVATYTAMQEAVQRMTDDLGPAAVEATLGDEGGGGGSLGRMMGGGSNRKAKLWDSFKERWTARAAPYDNGMVDVFMMYFGEAYGRAMRKKP